MADTMLESRASEAPGGGGGDRTSWKDAGKAAEFAWIPKAELRIDPSYQRTAKQSRVTMIARDWNWVACGSICVALRPDGEWYVFDGQHRVLAAQRRDDIADLPCLIFEMVAVKQEAGAFVLSNVGRKPMSYAERFKAMLKAEDLIAIKVDGLVDGSGRRIAADSGAGTISCISALMTAMKDHERELRQVFPIVCEICDGGSLDNQMLRGMLWLQLAIKPESLVNAHWRAKLRNLGPAEIRKSMAASINYRGMSGEKTWGLGILNALNKRARGRKLAAKGSDQ